MNGHEFNGSYKISSEDRPFGWFQLSCYIALDCSRLFSTSAIMTPLLVQSIVKKYFEDARFGWLKLSCRIAGAYSWLSSHFCSYGNFLGPLDRK